MIFEWIMGNFFPMMVMGLFTVFWLSFGMLQLPGLGLGAAYATEADPTGTLSPEYNAAVALYLIVWGFGLLTFFVFTLKINVIFALIFFLTTTATWVLAGAYWKLVSADYEAAGKLQKVSIWKTKKKRNKKKDPECRIKLLTDISRRVGPYCSS